MLFSHFNAICTTQTDYIRKVHYITILAYSFVSAYPQWAGPQCLCSHPAWRRQLQRHSDAGGETDLPAAPWNPPPPQSCYATADKTKLNVVTKEVEGCHAINTLAVLLSIMFSFSYSRLTFTTCEVLSFSNKQLKSKRPPGWDEVTSGTTPSPRRVTSRLILWSQMSRVSQY